VVVLELQAFDGLASRTAGKFWTGGTGVDVLYDEPMPPVGRPWFLCPFCNRRCRHLYILRDRIASIARLKPARVMIRSIADQNLPPRWLLLARRKH
jgi:hypothetical protein